MSDAAWPRILSDPGLAAVSDALLAEVGRLGPFEVRYRKSAVQLVRPDGSGFAAMAPGVDGLVLTIVVDQTVTSPRISVAQRLSNGAWNQRVTLGAVPELDDEVRGWLAAAYRRA